MATIQEAKQKLIDRIVAVEGPEEAYLVVEYAKALKLLVEVEGIEEAIVRSQTNG